MNPIALAGILGRVRKIKCPNCGHVKAVTGRCEYRICPKCHRRFPDPLAAKKSKRR